MSDAVSNLLDSKGISYMPSGKDYLIKCLNPEHPDNNPSCRVDRISGVSHCFACGWKRNLFKHFGIFTNNTPVKIAALKAKIDALRTSLLEIDLPEGHTPYTQSHRGISVHTFKCFEAFYTHKVEKLVDRIVFPIKDIEGKIVAFIGRHVLSNGEPRYVVHPSGRPLPLYPAKFDEPSKNMILVEGMFDLLNLFNNGIRNAVCTFGTSTISEDNVQNKLLPYKAQGIQKIFILYDGDTPGQEAAKKLKPILESQGFIVEHIEMEDGLDPGNMDADAIQLLKDYTL